MRRLLVVSDVSSPIALGNMGGPSDLGLPRDDSGFLSQGSVSATSVKKVRFTLPGAVRSSSSPALSSVDSGLPATSPLSLHFDSPQVMVGAGNSSTQFPFDEFTLPEPSPPPGPILNYITPDLERLEEYDVSEHSGKCGYITFCFFLIIFFIVCTVVLSVILALGLEESNTGATEFRISTIILIAFSLGVSVTLLLTTSAYFFISSLPSLSSLLRGKNTRLPGAEDHVDV